MDSNLWATIRKEYPELSAKKIFQEILPMGYGRGYSGVKKYIHQLRVPTPKAFLRRETLPGEFAQVDGANIGAVPAGSAYRKLSCFIMVLSFSRMLYLEFTHSQCMEDFLACHVNAFRFFVEHGELIKIEGGSYRVKKRRQELLGLDSLETKQEKQELVLDSKGLTPLFLLFLLFTARHRFDETALHPPNWTIPRALFWTGPKRRYHPRR